MFASVDGTVTQLLLDSQNLIVLRKSVRAARCARLYLTDSKCTNEVTDEIVLSLSRSVRDHDTPASLLTHVAGLDRLSDRTNLVYLKEHGITLFLIDAHLNAHWVRHKEIISDNLHAIAHTLSHLYPSGEVILVKWILNGNDGVFLRHVVIDINKLIWGHDTIVLSRLLAQVVIL